jgi:signal transduction histidine kinase/phage shock protein PspC (stress-responsive transcriptional regulator)
VVAGVAGGLGEQLGVDPMVIRLSFVVLAFAGGFGVILYLIGWLAAAEPEGEPAYRPSAPGSASRHLLASGLVVSGMLLLLKEAGLWFGTGLVVSVGLAAFGSALIWTRGDGAERARLTRMASRLPGGAVEEASGRVPRLRLAGGAALVIAGMATFLAASNVLRAAGQVAVAVAVTAAGLALILGPWVLRLVRQATDERRQRIRSEERADVAAHLHDSVLQTLALIQRSSDPRQMAILARGQERELRGWLYGRATEGGLDGHLLSVALDQAAGRVERVHSVSVEVVTVGDCPLDDRLRAMVEASAEAMANAARHSGARAVSVYAEMDAQELRVFVRDQGRGFDPAAVPPGRRGIADSIRSRMERHGGLAAVTSVPGEGTEVLLRMPRSRT